MLVIRKGVMGNRGRFLGKVCLLMCMLVAPAVSQSPMRVGTRSAVSGPNFDLSAGYSYVSMPIPGAQRVPLNGIDVGLRMDFHPRLGVMLDSSYARTGNMLGTGHMGYVLTSQIGPVFYLAQSRNTRTFVRFLGGLGLVDGATPITATTYFHGWQSQFSYSAGGGVERWVSGPLGVRVNGDFLRTGFFDSAGVVRPQNNLRLTVSLVFRLKNRPYGAP